MYKVEPQMNKVQIFQSLCMNNILQYNFYQTINTHKTTEVIIIIKLFQNTT